MQLCIHSKDISTAFEKRLLCLIDNQNCCHVRWCSQDRCIKMIPSYIQCKNYTKEEINGTDN